MGYQTSHGLSGHRDGAPRPAGRALVAIMLGLASGAWLLSARLATPDMRLGVLTGATTMSAGSRMGMPSSMSMGLSVFIATWTLMMVAMMVPSLVPAARAFDTWARPRESPGGATALFITGYLPVWITIGVVATPPGTTGPARRAAAPARLASVCSTQRVPRRKSRAGRRAPQVLRHPGCAGGAVWLRHPTHSWVGPRRPPASYPAGRRKSTFRDYRVDGSHKSSHNARIIAS